MELGLKFNHGFFKIIIVFFILLKCQLISAEWLSGRGYANQYSIDNKTFENTLISGRIIYEEKLATYLEITNSDTRHSCFISGIATGTNQIHLDKGVTGKEVEPGQTVRIYLAIYQSRNNPIQRIDFDYRYWGLENESEKKQNAKLKIEKRKILFEREEKSRKVAELQQQVMEHVKNINYTTNLMLKSRTVEGIKYYQKQVAELSKSLKLVNAELQQAKDALDQVSSLPDWSLPEENIVNPDNQTKNENSSSVQNINQFILNIQLYISGEHPGPLKVNQGLSQIAGGYQITYTYKNAEKDGSLTLTVPFKNTRIAYDATEFDLFENYKSPAGDNFVKIIAKDDSSFSSSNGSEFHTAYIHCSSKAEAEALAKSIKSKLK
jgi:hypothetical protein